MTLVARTLDRVQAALDKGIGQIRVELTTSRNLLAPRPRMGTEQIINFPVFCF
ncbi:MAG TPA: hypothetical protein VJQ56_06580 [Blastocatellia bacterium]|nr:hypothetical protein [Blastocatellia bacterium]